MEQSDRDTSREFAAEADDFFQTIVASFRHIPTRRHKDAATMDRHAGVPWSVRRITSRADHHRGEFLFLRRIKEAIENPARVLIEI